MMKIIKVSTSNPELSELFLRQTANGLGIWKDCQFFINQPIERCDWWIVCHYSGIRITESTICDPNHIVFISMEPTDSWIPDAFFKQFNQLVLCDRSISHPNIHYKNGLTWWIGINVRNENGHHFSSDFTLNYDSLKLLLPPPKQNRISIVCSNKQAFPGHKKRIAFIEKLRTHPICSRIDFFGEGYKTIPDKWDVIAPYKYHLVLENSVLENYWTEKLADAFLGFAYPIYYGCPNISDFFGTKSFSVIDIENFDQTVSVLENILSEDKYSDHVAAIIEARNKVLDDYNIFQLMTDISKEPAKSYKKCKLRPISQIQQYWIVSVKSKILYHLKKIQ